MSDKLLPPHPGKELRSGRDWCEFISLFYGQYWGEAITPEAIWMGASDGSLEAFLWMRARVFLLYVDQFARSAFRR